MAHEALEGLRRSRGSMGQHGVPTSVVFFRFVDFPRLPALGLLHIGAYP